MADSNVEANTTLNGAVTSQEHSDKDKKDDIDHRCGYLSYRPGWLQTFDNPKFLLVLLCAFGFTQSFVVNGINNVNTTTYERRFGLISSEVGIISSAYDIAAGLLVVPITYFALSGHKHFMCGVTVGVMGVGSFLMWLPHFTTDNYVSGEDQLDVCTVGNSTGCAEAGSDLSNYLYVLIAGQLLHGVGGTVFHSVGVSCMDDCVSTEISPIYVGILFGFGALGPGVGYVLGGYLLDFYVDFDMVSRTELTPDDPRWVGAWWVGFVIAMGVAILLVIPFLGLPREMPQTKEVQSKRVSEAHTDGSEEDEDSGVSLREFPSVTWMLLKNRTFMLITAAACTQFIVFTGFATFTPKFIQNQFGQTTSFSAILSDKDGFISRRLYDKRDDYNFDIVNYPFLDSNIPEGPAYGVVSVPGVAGGYLIGGLLCRRFQLKVRGIMRLCLGSCLISLVATATLWAKCDETKTAGVNVSYNDSSVRLTSPSLEASCNAPCGCDQESYAPVCGSNRIQYFSACHAGCLQKDGKNYRSCLCINSTVDANQTATEGVCETSCPVLYVFLPFFFILIVLTFVPATPVTMATMRCVPVKYKTFALGIHWFFGRFLGTVPGPILFGAIIDSACIVWKRDCGSDAEESCWIYDNFAMSRNFFLSGIGLKCLSSVLFLIASLVYQAPIGTNDKKTSKSSGDSSGESHEIKDGSSQLNLDIQGNNASQDNTCFDNPASDRFNNFEVDVTKL